MSFLEIETWEIAAGAEADHHRMMREWFRFVREFHADLFPEWKSARYYRQVDLEGRPSGRYIMVFEFNSLAGRNAYKQRRRDWSGPYEAYKAVAPDPYFKPGSETVENWEPQETDLWLKG